MDDVLAYLNSKIGNVGDEMVKHGAAMQFETKFARSVHVFTPDGKYNFYEDVERDFYLIYFPRRKPLGELRKWKPENSYRN